MTADLSSKTVEEMKTELFNILKRYPAHAAVETIIVSFLFELARRLEEAQQRNAAHDAEIAAEVLEEAARDCLSDGMRESLSRRAAEYRAKAKACP